MHAFGFCRSFWGTADPAYDSLQAALAERLSEIMTQLPEEVSTSCRHCRCHVSTLPANCHCCFQPAFITLPAATALRHAAPSHGGAFSVNPSRWAGCSTPRLCAPCGASG